MVCVLWSEDNSGVCFHLYMGSGNQIQGARHAQQAPAPLDLSTDPVLFPFVFEVGPRSGFELTFCFVF